MDLVGRALALRRKTRWFPVGLHAGINTEKEITGGRVTGPELALQLPIFDTGSASITRLEAEHRRAQRQLEALAIDARSEVREQRDRMLAARDLALFYDRELLPQRARILDLTLRQYNAMFKGAYDLLLAKEAEVEAEKARLDAWRDYWIARSRLEKALGGGLPAAAPPAEGGEAMITRQACTVPGGDRGWRSCRARPLHLCLRKHCKGRGAGTSECGAVTCPSSRPTARRSRSS